MSDLIDLRDVQRELSLSMERLRRMSVKNEFPEVLHLTRGEYRVRRSDYEAWMAGRWTEAMEARSRIEWANMRAKLLGAQ